MRFVKLNQVSILFITLLLTISFASAADPGHSAPSISSGTFESGNYVFPDNLTVGTRTLFVNSGSSFVGIGTLTPSSQLEVNASITGSVRIRGDGTGGPARQAILYLTSTSNENRARGIIIGNNTNDRWFIGTPYNHDYFSIGMNLTNPDYTSSSLFLINNVGNVGIGTTTPSMKLDVRGNGNFSGLVYVNNGTEILTYVNTNVNANLTASQTYTNNNLNANITAVHTNLTSSFVPYVGATNNLIYGNYNITIGLGRTTPKANLDINGSFAAISHLVGGGSYNIGPYGYAFGALVTNGKIDSSGYASLAQGRASSGGNITASGFGGSFARGTADGGAILSSNYASLAQGYTSSGGNITASNYASLAQGYSTGSAELIASGEGAIAQGYVSNGKIISSGGGALAQGFVSQGNMTASGAGAVTIGDILGGNTTANGRGSFAGGAVWGSNIISSGIGSFVWGNASSSSGNYGIVFGQGVQNTLNDSFSVGFGNIGNTPTLFVNGSNAGIGIITPKAKLHVQGDVILNASATSGNVVIQL